MNWLKMRRRLIEARVNHLSWDRDGAMVEAVAKGPDWKVTVVLWFDGNPRIELGDRVSLRRSWFGERVWVSTGVLGRQPVRWEISSEPLDGALMPSFERPSWAKMDELYL